MVQHCDNVSDKELGFIGCRLVGFVAAPVPSRIEQNEPVMRL
jgi:hypothetical protein